MKDLLFNLEYVNLSKMLIQVAFFIAFSGILLYLIYFVLTKVMYKKESQRKELSLRLTFLWSLLLLLLFFNIYFLLLIYYNGIESFHWGQALFYLGVLGQIIIFLMIVVLFFIRRYRVNKIINDNSIN